MLKLAFLSSTCPEWTFEQMVEAAGRYGYEGLDLRVELKHRHGLEQNSPPAARRRARMLAAEHGAVSWASWAIRDTRRHSLWRFHSPPCRIAISSTTSATSFSDS